jgi:palmitoyltransferase
MTMEDIAAGGHPMQQQTSGPDIVGFLHKYRQINENLEYAATKQFKVEIDVFPNDLPRELAERRVLLEHYEEQRRLLKFKDDVIWKLTEELKRKYDYYQEEFDKETRHEMNEWARLVDRYASELKKYELVCAFCGQHLSDANVNTDCPENTQKVPPVTSGRSQQHTSEVSGPGMVYFTDEDPPHEAIGGRKHFFGRPSLRGYKQNPFRAQTPGLLKDEVILQNPETQSVLRRIAEQQAPLEERFAQ